LIRVPGCVEPLITVRQIIGGADRGCCLRRDTATLRNPRGDHTRPRTIIEPVTARVGHSAPIRLWESERVSAVFWIEGNPAVPLGIVLCPRGGSALEDELREIAQSGVQILVSLLELDEADWLGLSEESALAAQLGMRFLSYPIQDVNVPANVSTFRTFVSALADRLRGGERIGLHCRGSIGRAPLTAACTLIQLGWDAEDALAAIQATRGYNVPDTSEQLRWILHYKVQP
jgi:protein-tyrosine phosphatase